MIKRLKRIFKTASNDDFIQTFTKKWVSRLMWFAILSTSFTYVLAAVAIVKGLSHKIIASLVDLSKYGIYMIIGVMFIYMIKAFLGKYAEEKNKLLKLQSPKEWAIDNEEASYDDEEECEEEE